MSAETTQTETPKVDAAPTTDFTATLESLKKKIEATQRFQLLTKDETCNVPYELALGHAACMSVVSDKLRASNTVYLCSFFNADINAAVVYFNNKPALNADDSICIWRATKAVMNRSEIAESIAMTLACILTAIGYDVWLNDSPELFTSIIKGSENVKSPSTK